MNPTRFASRERAGATPVNDAVPAASRRERAAVGSARERILRAAARLYARQGYGGTSIREIAAAAAVTKPLVYYHFGTKAELFACLLRESIAACRGAARDVLRQNTGAEARLHAMLRAQFARARAAPEVVAFAHEVMTMPGMLPVRGDPQAEGRELFATYVRLIEAGQRQGEFRRIDPQLVVVMAIAAVAAYAAAALAGKIPAIPAGTEDTVYDLMVHGIGGRSATATRLRPAVVAARRIAAVRPRPAAVAARRVAAGRPAARSGGRG